MHLQIVYEIAKYDLKVFHALLWNKKFREFIEGNDGYWRDLFIKLYIVTIDFDTTMFNGRLHSVDDKPAIVFSFGRREWWRHGKPHRDGDKPAAIGPKGGEEHYRDGKLHRDGDKPAIVYPGGSKEFWKDGEQYIPGFFSNK